jgi:ribosomal protein S4
VGPGAESVFEIRRHTPTSSIPWPCIAPGQLLNESIDTGAKPSDIENKVTVSSIARRRLAVVVTRLKMAETVSDVSVIKSASQ